MKRIAVVDDNALSVEGICKNVDWAALGTEVAHTLYDAPSLLAALGEGNIDIVISDIRMPQMDGLEMSKRILEQHPETVIILISAYSDFDQAQQAIRLGVFDYVEKPVDYAYLSGVVGRAVEQVDRERRQLEQLKRSLPALTENFFKELLHTSGDEARYNLRDYAGYLNLKLDWRFFNCAILAIEDAAGLKQRLGIEKYHTRMVGLREDIQEAFAGFALVNTLTGLNQIIVISAMPGRAEAEMSCALNEAATRLARRYQDRQPAFNIGIGSIVGSFWQLSSSYGHAKNALEYRYFFPQKVIFDIRDAAPPKHSGQWMDVHLEDQIIGAICKGDLAEARKVIDLFMAQFLGDYYGKSSVFISLYSILGRIIKLLNDMGASPERVQKEIVSAFRELESASARQTAEWLYRICGLTLREMEKSMDSHNRAMSRAVYGFIEKNYANTELCLNDIAAHVNISPAHLSAVFKKTNDENISDVITNTRIEAAKGLLELTSLSIKEISDRTGFSNQYYFSACFKKKVGTTPSDYRAGATGPKS